MFSRPFPSIASGPFGGGLLRDAPAADAGSTSARCAEPLSDGGQFRSWDLGFRNLGVLALGLGLEGLGSLGRL